jgi:anti-sigma regulatory factor (Ser/Thr protein kinase)
VGIARRGVGRLLTEWGIGDEARDDAILVVSELVTNAVAHTASEHVVCRVRLDGPRLHIEVEDQNRGLSLPARCRPGPDDQGGRGLVLVGVLSSDWGVRDAPYGSGRVVWAELSLHGAGWTAPTAPPHLRPVPHPAEGSLPHGTTTRR